MLNYIGQFIVFISAIIAIRGGTWDIKNKRVTKIGYVTIAILVIGLVISGFNISDNEKKEKLSSAIADSTKANSDTTKSDIKLAKVKLDSSSRVIESLKQRLQEAHEIAKSTEAKVVLTNNELKDTKDRLDYANIQLGSLNTLLDIANRNLEESKNDLKKLEKRSERQEQIEMVEPVHFSYNESWTTPTKVFGGSTIILNGFHAVIHVHYGDDPIGTRFEILDVKNGHAELTLFANSGEKFFITLTSPEYKEIIGKIIVKSTPRIRSPKSSTEE